MESLDITRGPIGRTLVALAWPVIAGEAIHVAFHLVDVAWVGPLGAWATGAIMTSMFTLWLAFALMNLVTVGLGAHVSRSIGAGHRERAGKVVAQSIWLAAILSIPVAMAGWWGSPPLFGLLVTDSQVARAGGSYLAVISLGLPFMFLSGTGSAAMRACGNTRTPLLVGGVALLANAALAPLFVYGLGPFPRWGVTGSAVATVLCQSGATLAYVILGWRRHPDMPIDLASLRRPDAREIGAVARVGAPYFGVGALFSLVYLWYARLASPFGAAALAVLGIGNRLESITYLSADGFGVATSTFVGQNLGAKNPARAEQGTWKAARLMSLVGALVGVLMFAAPAWLLAPFTRDADALALGVPWLRALALCQVFVGLEGVIGGAFAGAGDTVAPMLVHVGVAILRVPLAAWAVTSLALGPMGIAWSMVLTCMARSCLLALWFHRGRWKSVILPGSQLPLASPEGPDAHAEGV